VRRTLSEASSAGFRTVVQPVASTAPNNPPLARQRTIPRNDATNHADWGFDGHRRDAAAKAILHGFAIDVQRLGSEILNALLHAGFRAAHRGDRSAHIHRLDFGEFIDVPFDELIGAEQKCLPVVGRPCAPRAFEGGTCRADSAVDILSIASSDISKNFAG